MSRAISSKYEDYLRLLGDACMFIGGLVLGVLSRGVGMLG